MKNYVPRGAPATDGRAQDRNHQVPTIKELVGLAVRLDAARACRSEFMPYEILAEPGWDMLVALFLADAAGRRATVTNLCNESRVPLTTALRWIEKLVDCRLVRRARNPLDARIIFIELENKGRTAMIDYLSQMWAVFYHQG